MNIQELKLIANNIRRTTIEMVYHAGSGHIGSSLSAADILTALYFDKMNVDPQQPEDPDRDRLVLSKGHMTPALYAALALKGFIPKEDLWGFRKIDSDLQGHPVMKKTPGVDMSTGSLGQGISAAVGMALSGKIDHKDFYVYALLGDGECEEGQVWEAAMFAANNQLDHLILIIDNNGFQVDGPTADVNPPYPLDRKFKAFNFNVITVSDGHDIEFISQAIEAAKQIENRKPTVIISKTIKGKGVSFMESRGEWHSKIPDAYEYEAALEELQEVEETL